MRFMNASPNLRRLAGTVGDARRVQMLALLMEGRAGPQASSVKR
jgi:hypothetical protein